MGPKNAEPKTLKPTARPDPTALFWCLASLFGFALAIAFAVIYVRSPKTVGLGLTGPFYYVLLVVLGCSAALLLLIIALRMVDWLMLNALFRLRTALEDNGNQIIPPTYGNHRNGLLLVCKWEFDQKYCFLHWYYFPQSQLLYKIIYNKLSY